MKKSELVEEIQTLKETNQALLTGGLEFQKRFETAYKLLLSARGLCLEFKSREPELINDIDALLDKYELVQFPSYGLKVVPKPKM